jgi:hypothetical protein
MATTTNYGWSTPDDTALVKDGAAAIRTLGSSVDTTTKALNPSTTLGDLEYRSATANTNTRLGIGSTGNILTVAGGVPTWAAPAATTPSFVGCALKVSTGQSLNSGTETIINFDQEDFDTDAFHDNVTNNSRITIPAGKAGKYLIQGKVTFPSSPGGNTSYRRMSIKLNTTTYFTSTQSNNATDGGGNNFNRTVEISQIINLSVGDFVTLTAQQASGSTVTTVTGFSDRDNVFTATYLGA